MVSHHELRARLIWRVGSGIPFGPRRELITKDDRIMVERTGRRDGVTATEWEMPYTAVDQYWSFKTGGGEDGPRTRRVTLVAGVSNPGSASTLRTEQTF